MSFWIFLVAFMGALPHEVLVSSFCLGGQTLTSYSSVSEKSLEAVWLGSVFLVAFRFDLRCGENCLVYFLASTDVLLLPTLQEALVAHFRTPLFFLNCNLFFSHALLFPFFHKHHPK